MAARGFTPIDVAEQPEQQPHAQPSEAEANAARLLGIALRSLSQRAVIALSSLFTAAGLFAVWWLFYSILPEPTVLQLVGASLFAIFFLLVELVRRR